MITRTTSRNEENKRIATIFSCPTTKYSNVKLLHNIAIANSSSRLIKRARSWMENEQRDKIHGSAQHLREFDLGEDVDAVIGVTAAALVGDQLIRATESRKHKASHLMKAGVSAAVALGAFKMLHREHDEKHHSQQRKHPSNTEHQGGSMHQRVGINRTGRSRTPKDSHDNSSSEDLPAGHRLVSSAVRLRSFSRHREDEWSVAPSSQTNKVQQDRLIEPSFSPHRHRRPRSLSPYH